MGIHPISNKLRDNNEPYAIHDSRRTSRWHPCQHRIIIAAFRLFQKSKNYRIRHEKIVTYPAVLPFVMMLYCYRPMERSTDLVNGVGRVNMY